MLDSRQRQRMEFEQQQQQQQRRQELEYQQRQQEGEQQRRESEQLRRGICMICFLFLLEFRYNPPASLQSEVSLPIKLASIWQSEIRKIGFNSHTEPTKENPYGYQVGCFARISVRLGVMRELKLGKAVETEY